MEWSQIAAVAAAVVLFLAFLAAVCGYLVFRMAIRRPVKPKPESKDPRKI